MSFFYSIPLWAIWLITVFSGIMCYFAYQYQKFRRYARLIDKLPGPKPSFFFGNIRPIIGAPTEDWFFILSDISMGFSQNPLHRVWSLHKATVCLNQPEAIEAVLNSNKLLDKSHAYNNLHPWLGLGLLTSTGDKWRTRRKLITPSFHFRILDEFFKVFVEHTECFVNILETLKDKDYFDIQPYLTRCTLDIICETAMGKRICAQSNATSEYVQALLNLTYIVNTRMLLPWLSHDWIFNLTSYGRQQKKYLKVLHGFTIQVIKERWAEISTQNKDEISGTLKHDNENIGEKRKLAFLDMLLEIYRDSQKLNFEDIREEVDTFMFEGHDTTSTGLCWILYNIGRFPEIQQRIHQEIDDLFGNSKRSLSKDDLPELKYLELVIKESLRLFPPVPNYTRKTAEATEICGHTIPAGTELLIHNYVIHRNEKYYPDPEKFDPDRFLPENCTNRHPFAYIPFSAGPRNCIGQKFAMMEMKTVVCQILRNFNIKSKHRVDEIKILSDLVLRPVNGMWVKLESRH